MRSWNLLYFDDVVPNVLSSVDKEASVVVPSMRRQRKPFSSTTIVGAVGSVVLVAAISLTSLQVNVCGSDDTLRLSSVVSISNIQNDRPPLALLFSASHPLKWDAAKQNEMLARAATAVAAANPGDNQANLIHAVLREDLPKSREDAIDLTALGIKLG
jgi:hypothetical protein